MKRETLPFWSIRAGVRALPGHLQRSARVLGIPTSLSGFWLRCSSADSGKRSGSRVGAVERLGNEIAWKNKKAVPHHTERRFSAGQRWVASGRKGFAATTTLPRVGIADFEPAGSQAVAEIHHRAAQVLGAERINQDLDPKQLGKKIIRALFVKGHRVLHAGATALLDVDPERFASILRLLQQRLYFPGGARGYLHYRVGGDAHIHS